VDSCTVAGRFSARPPFRRSVLPRDRWPHEAEPSKAVGKTLVLLFDQALDASAGGAEQERTDGGAAVAGSGRKGRLRTSYLIFLNARWPAPADVGVSVVLDWEADQPAVRDHDPTLADAPPRHHRI
jgi:hypothetical protein